ncbi:hypothetical protein [Natronorubrum sp. DTA28]|uniref:hypothetical protein n=1 Tax=Natronorubrum sp. DTA28 TaxID=3447019 RepID=UPI003F860A3A
MGGLNLSSDENFNRAITLDLLPMLWVFTVDFYRVEVRVALPKATVPERVGDDCDAVVLVCEFDGFFGRKGTGIRAFGWLRADSEKIALCRRYLNTGDTGIANRVSRRKKS